MPQPKSSLEILAGHLTSLPVLLLGGATVLSLASGAVIDAVVILAVVIANAAVGYVTERRVERIMMSLQSAGIPQALVRRDGEEMIVPAAGLVPGDVLVLKVGHDVPADARVLNVAGLAVDEAALTGESMPVAKVVAALAGSNGALADRVNMLYAGTIITEGTGTAVVTATGRRTELGRIRALVAETATPSTPLERQLDRVGRRLVGVSLGACAAALGLGLLRGVPLLEMARSAISLAVAAVPEGLPAVATTTLALGTQRMLRRGTLVRRLAAVESLGAVTVICADKTGTLTENRMTVDSWCVGRREYGQGKELAVEATVDFALARALSVAILCNEAELGDDGAEGKGSSTEAALLVAGRDAGLDYRADRRRHPPRARPRQRRAARVRCLARRRGEPRHAPHAGARGRRVRPRVARRQVPDRARAAGGRRGRGHDRRRYQRRRRPAGGRHRRGDGGPGHRRGARRRRRRAAHRRLRRDR